MAAHDWRSVVYRAAEVAWCYLLCSEREKPSRLQDEKEKEGGRDAERQETRKRRRERQRPDIEGGK